MYTKQNIICDIEKISPFLSEIGEKIEKIVQNIVFFIFLENSELNSLPFTLDYVIAIIFLINDEKNSLIYASIR